MLNSRLFPAPQTLGELNSGVGRQWPDARGAYLTDGSFACKASPVNWVAAQELELSYQNSEAMLFVMYPGLL